MLEQGASPDAKDEREMINKTSENRRLTKLMQKSMKNLKRTEVCPDGTNGLLLDTPERTEIGMNSFLVLKETVIAGSEIKSSNQQSFFGAQKRQSDDSTSNMESPRTSNQASSVLTPSNV